MSKKVSVIGGGSWATALVKILAENKVHVTWYLRREEQADAVNKNGTNPDYLNFVSLNKPYVLATNDLDKALVELQLKSGDRFKLQFFDFDLNILPSDLALNSL